MVPPLAIAAATIASCSGVSVSLNWPIDDNAICAGSVRAGYALALTGSGIVSFELLKPYALAMLCSAEPPTVTPSLANAVLQDTVRANWMGGCPLPQGAPASFARVLWLPGSR